MDDFILLQDLDEVLKQVILEELDAHLHAILLHEKAKEGNERVQGIRQ